MVRLPVQIRLQKLNYWSDVIIRTVYERGMQQHDAFAALSVLPRWCTCVNALTRSDGTAYFFSKIGQWIGPKLGALANKFAIDYDATQAHDALYDVKVTAACLKHQLKLIDVAPGKAEHLAIAHYAGRARFQAAALITPFR